MKQQKEPYTVERHFLGERTVEEIVIALVRVHS